MEDITFTSENVGVLLQSKNLQERTLSLTDGDVQSKTEECAEDESITTALGSPSILDLSGKSLKSLTIVLSNQLQRLNISDNHFETLPDELSQLISLCNLTVSQNKLVELPDWIGDLRNLASIELSSNNLQSLPASFSKLNLLKELDLSNNKFFKIPDCLQVGCISLQNINLSHNSIESWTCHPASASTLQILNLAQNSFITVPPWLCNGKARRLISLDLSMNSVFNQVQTPPKTAHKSALRQLNVSHCSLYQKDLNFLGQFSSLTHLELGNYLPKQRTKYENILREIDLSVLSFRTSLIQLYLCDLSLTDLPDDMQELVSLELLDCRDNNILMLPDSICKLARLRVCLLSNNNLCVLPDNIGELTSLKELRLEKNNIGFLPESVGNLQNLCWLDLYGNVINEIPNQLEKIIENLQGLDFEFNHVSLYSDPEAKNDGVSWLSKEKYESLLKCMRSYRVRSSKNDVSNSAAEEVRVTGCRPPSVNRDDYSCDSSYGNNSDYDSDNQSENEGRLPLPEYEEDDNWDTALSDSDNFDPIEHSSRPKLPEEEKRVVIIPHHIIQRHRFCPSDLHVTPTKEITSGITYAPEDGQFDDA